MRILAISDVHMNLDFLNQIVDEARTAALLVCAGDFAIRGGSCAAAIEILATIKCPMILVSGNHDNLLELTRLCDEFAHMHLLHGDLVNVDGVDFYGLGCEIPQRSEENWNEWLSEEVAEKMLHNCPVGAVLVTHSPAIGHCDLQIYGANEGSEAVLDAIVKKRPRLHLCGHIHNAWGVSSLIGDTPTHNLGPSVNWFEI